MSSVSPPPLPGQTWSAPDYSRALVHISLSSLDEPGKELRDGLLNPATLNMDIDVAVGELNPVGWSQTVLQYGHTKSLATAIELYFSDQLCSRQNGPRPFTEGPKPKYNAREWVDWLASFCYAASPGRAPSPLLIIWPNVMNIAAVVKKFRAEYMRFKHNLIPSAAKVMLDCIELRISYRNSALQNGLFLERDSLLGSMSYSESTGRPTNFGGSGVRR